MLVGQPLQIFDGLHYQARSYGINRTANHLDLLDLAPIQSVCGFDRTARKVHHHD